MMGSSEDLEQAKVRVKVVKSSARDGGVGWEVLVTGDASQEEVQEAVERALAGHRPAGGGAGIVSEATTEARSRCARCGGALVPSSAVDLGPVCLSCGRPSAPPPERLPLTHEGRSRRDRSQLPEQVLALLRSYGPLPRTAIRDALRVRAEDLRLALLALLQQGSVLARPGQGGGKVWHLADGTGEEEAAT